MADSGREFEELGIRDVSNVAHSRSAELPSRYTAKKTRGGRRRQTTLNKRKQLKQTKEEEIRDDHEQQMEEEERAHVPNVVDKYKLSYDSSSDDSPDENYEVDSIASSIEEGLTWRGRMQAALHNTWFHVVIVLLVVADAFIVLFELLLDVGAFGNLQCSGENSLEQNRFCHFDSDGNGCGPTAEMILENINISASPERGTGVDGLCHCLFRGGKFVCGDSSSSGEVNPGLVLHIVSLMILTIFVLEILVKLIAFRLKYFTHKFEVFDGCIVVLSYVLDWASLHEEEAFEVASLVIILRLWRVVRIVNGAALSVKSQSDKQLSEARLKAQTIVHAFHKAQDRLDELEEENEKLKKQLVVSSILVKRPRGNQPSPLLTDDTTDPNPSIGAQMADEERKRDEVDPVENNTGKREPHISFKPAVRINDDPSEVGENSKSEEIGSSELDMENKAHKKGARDSPVVIIISEPEEDTTM